jgi:TonB-dependent SusC/RagA subfamily outer membrane receptor
VVTTATGVQRKIEVGNDITTLSVDSIRQVAPITSVTDLLETRVPGLTVVHSSGTPGDPSRLRLRGAGSIQMNNDPIVIVDGMRVYASQSDSRNQNLAPSKAGNASGGGLGGNPYNAPSPLDQIDPNNIATIEVLKGPSATAIYGSDAASGVIVITTKRGEAGPTRWSADVSQGVNWLPGEWPTNYYRFGHTLAGASTLCAWNDLTCAIDSTVAFQALNDPRYSVFAHGSDQQVTLTVSGGLPTLIYNLTASGGNTLGNLKLPGSEIQRYDSLYGLIPHTLVRPDRYTTWSGAGTLTASPMPTMHATLQSSLFNSTQHRSALDGALTQLSGRYLSPTTLAGPLLHGEYERATADQLTANNSVALQWQPRSWLPLQGSAGINTMQRNDVSYVPYGIYDDEFDANQNWNCTFIFCGDTTGSYGLGRGTSRVMTVTVGTAIPTFAQKVTVAVGGNFYSTNTADFAVYTDQLAPGVSEPTTFLTPCVEGSSALCNSPTRQSTFHQSTYGWYVEPRLNVLSRFFMSPGFRLDGGSGAATSSSKVGGLSAFPKMDFSYIAIDRQSERPLWGFLSLLRPRLAFGYAGTQPAPSDKLRLYNIGSYSNSPAGQSGLTSQDQTGCGPLVTLDGKTPIPAVCINALGNTQLRPERSSELEGGFDATLWQGRLSITYSQYNKTRQDAIIAIPVAQSVYSAGGSPFSIQKNIGVIRNTGTEVQLNATPLESRSIGWTLGANFSKNNNKVVRLNAGQLPIIMNGNGSLTPIQTRVEAGYALFGMFTRPIVGYADANDNGILDPDEIRYGDSVVYVGRPDPNYQVALTSDLTLFGGRLGVHAGFAYENGMTQTNSAACTSNAIRLLAPNPSFATQAAVVAAGCESSPQSAIGIVQTVNTFRFQTLSVNYYVPQRVSTWARIPRMSVALQGSNLGLHTNYRGKDPDVNAFATVSAGDETVDTGQLPEPRTWWLRITLGN